MADAKQLEQLKYSGIWEWNQWQIRQPDILVDLKGVNFREIELRGIHLIVANLELVNLRGACLKGAHLDNANLCA